MLCNFYCWGKNIYRISDYGERLSKTVIHDINLDDAIDLLSDILPKNWPKERLKCCFTNFVSACLFFFLLIQLFSMIIVDHDCYIFLSSSSWHTQAHLQTSLVLVAREETASLSTPVELY